MGVVHDSAHSLRAATMSRMRVLAQAPFGSRRNFMLEHHNAHLSPRPFPSPGNVKVRAFQPTDQGAVLRLYQDGLLTGNVDPRDPAIDLADIKTAYFKHPQNCFWVAEAEDEVVGTIALTTDAQRVAHVRRLRVARGWQDDNCVLCLLIAAATAHACKHDCLKLVLHTPLDDRQAIPMLHQVGFEFGRSRDVRGRHLLEFYLNLYARPQRPESDPGGIS
jgi:hypothetical protein